VERCEKSRENGAPIAAFQGASNVAFSRSYGRHLNDSMKARSRSPGCDWLPSDDLISARSRAYACGHVTSSKEAAMERLRFTCPRTGRDIDVGIVSELQTLLRIRSNKVRARCPACGQFHEWQVRDAQLLKAA
jgi:predicted RNA-binding Zn-ribbon protein involved in translation (DUF1610 family)